MSRTIWKFTLEITDEQEIEVPQGAEFLSVGNQNGDTRHLQLWALVDPGADREDRRIVIHGTGHPVLPSLHVNRHIGTVITMNGALVWHVFDAPRQP